MVATQNTSTNDVGTFGDGRVASIANEIERRAASAKDYVAPRSKLSCTVLGTGAESKLALVVQNGQEHAYPLTRTASQQLASSLDVPRAFVDRLESRGHADLVAATFSELLSRESKNERGAERKHLVRALDGQARAFLSDKFDRGASNAGLMRVALEAFAKVRAEVWNFQLSDDAFSIEGISPGLRAKVEHRMKATPGAYAFARNLDADWQHPAVSIVNSETGRGASEASVGLWTSACRNLAIMSKTVAKVHLGRRLEEGEQAILSEQTKQLEAAALFSKVNDTISFAFDLARFQEFMRSLSETTGRVLEDDVKASEVIELAQDTYGLSGARADGIMEAWLSSGTKSQYWLGQAFTAQANPERAKDLPDEDRIAFERAGGAILALGERDWGRFVADARAAQTSAQAKEERKAARQQTVARV